MNKAEYLMPSLRCHGRVELVSKGGAAGFALDASFPVNTPNTDLTFS
jgi:hypothetical protein